MTPHFERPPPWAPAGAPEWGPSANGRVIYLRIAIARLAAGRAGISGEMIEDTLRGQLEGVRSGIVAEGNRRIPIVLRGRASPQAGPAGFGDVLPRGAEGQTGPL